MQRDPVDTAPIINCHTHIFTVKDVPPLLGKTLIPWPFYFLFHIGIFASVLGSWIRFKNKIYREQWYKKVVRNLYAFRMALKRYFFLRLIKVILFLVVLFSFFHRYYIPVLKPWLRKQGLEFRFLDKADAWLAGRWFILPLSAWWVTVLLLLLFLVLFPTGRNLIFFVLRHVNRFFKMLPGKQTGELLKRYMNIVRYANYKEQSTVFSRLRLQYPPGSKMVVLPMDMEFMGAGKPARPFHKQMEMLAKIKDNHEGHIYPFVFVDPRRTQAGGKIFFAYRVEGHSVVLEDCFIKDYIEEKNFSGFKIYPALGYYPFDERLLPLWKYAADNGIPIMTHCIRGVVYYRGAKVKDWDYHPVFEQFMGDDKAPKPEDYSKLLLPQMTAVAVQEIFTHPLNYACLLKRDLLKKLVKNASDNRIRQLFGYNEKDGSISCGLRHLKICFGHFGGEDEWTKFFEKDRTTFGHQLIAAPDKGIDFLYTDKVLMRGKPEQLWKTADWYSIICSLMLQHEHIYADISYILHGDLQIMPLLRHTLQHSKLKNRVLYGSDFFVVRNHKSDKNMLADIKGGLLKDEFDQIARQNPVKFLEKSKVIEQDNE